VRWLVLGCGYTGRALARALVARGDADVTITRRDAAAAAQTAAALGARGLAYDLAAPLPALASPPPDVVVCLAPPGPDPAREMAHLAGTGAARVVYVSSTGVYAPGGGAWVDEAFPTAPTTAAGRARLAAEAALADIAPGAARLRAAGIYGADRSLVDRLRAGTYRIVGDGRACVSRIHVDDLVAAIVAAGTATTAGPINIADDDPAPIGEVADALAAMLGLPPPPRVPVAAVDAELAGMLAADRRIANARMKRDLGVALRHPSWRGLLDAGGARTPPPA
jgi:nucleoside-diphosphate-sugar epimerase